MNEVRRSLDPKRVNHILLLTDGHTYGDEQACLKLAEEAGRLNIGISGFGIGSDWNDIFLDTLASRTGKQQHLYFQASAKSNAVLIEKFNALTNTYAEDVDPGIQRSGQPFSLNYAFRLQPEAGPIAIQEPLHLGPILQDTPLNVLFEFLDPAIGIQGGYGYTAGRNFKSGHVARTPNPDPADPPQARAGSGGVPQNDPPPPAILNALSRLHYIACRNVHAGG